MKQGQQHCFSTSPSRLVVGSIVHPRSVKVAYGLQAGLHFTSLRLQQAAQGAGASGSLQCSAPHPHTHPTPVTHSPWRAVPNDLQVQEVLSTPLGQQLMPMLLQMEGQLGGATANGFQGGARPPA